MTTRFLNDPARVLLRERDSATGSYPTIARTGDPDRTGVYNVKFDDTDTVVFYTYDQSGVSTSRYANYPELLTVSDKHLVSRSPTGSIQAQAVIRAGLGDHLVKFYNPGESITPFVEQDLFEQDIREISFINALTGTDPNVLPGFSSPLKSKTILRFDITATRDHFFTTNPPRNDGVTPGGPFNGITNTGFGYFNFTSKEWQDIGVTDPATGGSLNFDVAVERQNQANVFDNIVSGTNLWCQQFVAPDQVQAATQPLRRVNTNLKEVGKPTSVCQAPAANRYHATASQTLSIGDYIKHPFLLERAVVHFEGIRAERATLWDATDQTAERYLDEYVVFLYRQRNSNAARDSALDVSGSERYIIASASMCFYNAEIKEENGVNPLPENFTPLHSPAFSYNFGQTQKSPPFNFQVSVFEDSVTLSMVPATVGPMYGGVFRITASNQAVGDSLTENAFVHNYWPGSTSIKSFLSSSFTGRDGVEAAFGSSTYNQLYSQNVSRTQDNLPIENFDHRAFAFYGKGLPTGAGYSNDTPVPTSTSPYLLLPGDNIVLGIDALNSLRDKQPPSSVTGSFLKILNNYRSTLTLYGSLLKDGVEFHDTLNQPLTSDAIHEDLHSNNPVLDQFEIEPIEAYAGSYIDQVIIGDITDSDPSSTRRVVGSVAEGTAGLTGSISRMRSFTSENEIFYDSVTPNLGNYIIKAGGIRVFSTGIGVKNTGYLGEKGYAITPGTGLSDDLGEKSRRFVESGSFRLPRVFDDNPSRILNDDAELIVTKKVLTWTLGTLTGDNLRDVLFRRGQRVSISGFGSDLLGHAIVSGSQGFRYGLYNNNPVKTQIAYRYNKFGQFRDMLEQRPYTAYFANAIRLTKIGGRTEGAIEINFISGSEVIKPVLAASSSNISIFATSSHPYSDGNSTN